MEEQEKSAAERLPYLELEEELPDSVTVSTSDAHEQNPPVASPTPSGLSNRSQPGRQATQRDSWWTQVRQTSPLTLAGLFLAMLVILLLLPQVMLILRGFLLEVLLIMRVLLLPLLALGCTIYLLRWYYNRSR